MSRHFWHAKQFEAALCQMNLTETNQRVLQAFLDAPAHTLTAHGLAQQAALPGGWTAANLRLGELSRKFRPYLGDLQPEDDGDPHWWRYTTTGIWREGRFHWTLRPELRDALLTLGWNTSALSLTPEEVPPELERQLVEGAVRRINVNAYERNSEARQACLETHGYTCAACGTLLEDLYGEAATRLIHVHHRVPLASIGGTYVVDGATDLEPVCPNCHAVMHRREPPYTVREIQDMLNRPRTPGDSDRGGSG